MMFELTSGRCDNSEKTRAIPCSEMSFLSIIGTQYRLDFAREKLGIDTINYHNEEEKVVDALTRLVPEGLDAAIDATAFRFAKSMTHKIERALGLESDTPEAITECLTALKKFGNLNIIGSYAGTANNFPIGFLFIKHLTVTAGISPTQRLWRYCLERIVDGSFDPTFIITHRMSLHDGPEMYEMMNDHQDGFIKGILRPEPIVVQEKIRAEVEVQNASGVSVSTGYFPYAVAS